MFQPQSATSGINDKITERQLYARKHKINIKKETSFFLRRSNV